MSIEDLKASFRRRRVEARVLLDGSLLEEHARLDDQLAKALLDDTKETGSIADGKRAPGLMDELRDLERRIEDAQTVFIFEGIGQYLWLNLVSDNPPDKEQRALGYDFNPDTFTSKALAESCVEPALTEEDARWLQTNLDVAEWARVWDACLKANIGERDRPKSWIATAAAITKNGSSTTAPPEGSLAQSS